jgi:hypothetical protein
MAGDLEYFALHAAMRQRPKALPTPDRVCTLETWSTLFALHARF